MRCKHCDATIPHGADKCPRCGTHCEHIATPPPPPPQKPPFHHRHAFACCAVFFLVTVALINGGMVMMNVSYDLLDAGLVVSLIGAAMLPLSGWFTFSHLNYW